MTKWLRLGFVLAMCVPAGWAVDWKALQPQGYVSDFASVISPEAKTQLEAYCAAVEQATGAQIALVTISSLEGEPVEDVSNTIFRAWGVGQKGKNEGILLLLAVNDHRSRLEVGYGLEPILPDGMDGRILREMRPALRQNDFSEALMAAAETIGGAIAEAKHVSLQAALPRRARTQSTHSIPWTMILGGIFVLLWLLRAGGPRGNGRGGGGGGGLLTGLILGSVLGRSGGIGGSSGGGFGGSDSGGGFGGFGGGDSGGGGASSDW